jgi:hypothetical protein
MKIRVAVYSSNPMEVRESYQEELKVREYVMDHDDPAQRRVLGEQCRNAFEGGQTILTTPVTQA